MHKLDPSRIGLPGLALLSLAMLVLVGIAFLDNGRVQTLTIAAGSSQGESYVLSQALKVVVERHVPKVRLIVRETGGTNENLQLLEKGQAQLATAQADVPAGSDARVIVALYEDVFQLVVPSASAVRSFADLKGLRIGLPRRGGQFASFLGVARHFGLAETDFQFVGEEENAADLAFEQGRADAIFRVRALGSPRISRMVKSGRVKFVPIRQAAAMRIQLPALESSMIPEGAYSGNPAIPPEDLSTVAVQRTLLAHKSVSATAIRELTAVLMDRRQEIADAIQPEFSDLRPLLARVKAPEMQSGLGAQVHEGAISYFDRDKPSFLQAHADFVGLLVTLILLGGSWLWELKRMIERRQKNQADAYSSEVVALLTQARACDSLASLDKIHSQLLDLLTRAVQELDEDRISTESFQSFRDVLTIALDVVRQRRLDANWAASA